MSLRGKRVVVTRAADQSEEIVGLLRAHGAEPLVVPLIVLTPLPIEGSGDESLRHMEQFQWIIFTSANAVRFFFEALKLRDASFIPEKVRCAAIGERTAKALTALGRTPDLIPSEAFASEELLDALKETGPLVDVKILFPRAEEARDVLLDGLRAEKALVTVLPVYRTLSSEEGEQKLKELMGSAVDWITFLSPSAVRFFFQLTGAPAAKRWLSSKGVKLAAIGRVTETALLEYELTAHAVAGTPTVEDLVLAMEQFA